VARHSSTIIADCRPTARHRTSKHTQPRACRTQTTHATESTPVRTVCECVCLCQLHCKFARRTSQMHPPRSILMTLGRDHATCQIQWRWFPPSCIDVRSQAVCVVWSALVWCGWMLVLAVQVVGGLSVVCLGQSTMYCTDRQSIFDRSLQRECSSGSWHSCEHECHLQSSCALLHPNRSGRWQVHQFS
jgi:hypothetical protein